MITYCWIVDSTCSHRTQVNKNSTKYLCKLNLAIRNFLVDLKLFLTAKGSLWSKWRYGHRKWFPNTMCSLSNRSLLPSLTVQSNLAIRNFWSKWQIGHLIPICSLSNRSLLPNLTVHIILPYNSKITFVVQNRSTKHGLVKIDLHRSLDCCTRKKQWLVHRRAFD